MCTDLALGTFFRMRDDDLSAFDYFEYFFRAEGHADTALFAPWLVDIDRQCFEIAVVREMESRVVFHRS